MAAAWAHAPGDIFAAEQFDLGEGVCHAGDSLAPRAPSFSP
jgi:hypothetical protein